MLVCGYIDHYLVLLTGGVEILVQLHEECDMKHIFIESMQAYYVYLTRT